MKFKRAYWKMETAYLEQPKSALILAAGKGTRLGSLAQQIPKCLVSLGSTNVLDLWIRKLHEAGVDQIYINTHHLFEQVIDFVSRHPLQAKIQLIHEQTLLGTAGTLISIKEKIDGAIFVVHADNFSEIDLNLMSETHSRLPMDFLGTALVFETDDIKGCGIFTLDSKGDFKSYEEKPGFSESKLANGALFTLNQRALLQISKIPNAFDFCKDVLPSIFHKMKPVPFSGTHIDIGTPDNLRIVREICSRLETIRVE